jgi:hypothetical protein
MENTLTENQQIPGIIPGTMFCLLLKIFLNVTLIYTEKKIVSLIVNKKII